MLTGSSFAWRRRDSKMGKSLRHLLKPLFYKGFSNRSMITFCFFRPEDDYFFCSDHSFSSKGVRASLRSSKDSIPRL